MTTFYTSDHHFHHKRVLEFENRPFETVEEMNEHLIKIWNETVKQNDTVHHLGDFCFGKYDDWVSILKRLNGNIVLYKGNHDSSKVVKQLYNEGYIKELHMVGDYIKVRSPKTNAKYQLWLTHYPMEIGMRPRKFSLHGHIHSMNSRMLNQVNVCIDSPLNFDRPFGKPVSEEELIDYLDYINPIVEKEFQKEREKWL